MQQAANARNGAIDPSTGQVYTYSQYTRAIGQEFTTSRVINQGYFIQDNYRLNTKLTLTYGLRYELFLRPAGVLNSAFAATGTIPQDFNNWAPRLAVAYDPMGWLYVKDDSPSGVTAVPVSNPSHLEVAAVRRRHGAKKVV